MTDKVKDGEVSITYKPTIEMPSDFLTKSLSGNVFEKYKSILLGFDLYPDYDDFYNKYNANSG